MAFFVRLVTVLPSVLVTSLALAWAACFSRETSSSDTSVRQPDRRLRCLWLAPLAGRLAGAPIRPAAVDFPKHPRRRRRRRRRQPRQASLQVKGANMHNRTGVKDTCIFDYLVLIINGNM